MTVTGERGEGTPAPQTIFWTRRSPAVIAFYYRRRTAGSSPGARGLARYRRFVWYRVPRTVFSLLRALRASA
jgi:hypothetical protein